MSTYSYQQLNSTGSIGEDITGDIIFEFINPSASSYLVLETITTSSFYSESHPKNFLGTFTLSSVSDIVNSPYIVGVVVPPGSSSFNFTPDSPISGSSYRIRGTGMFSLNIS
jgi:hypothetical protein